MSDNLLFRARVLASGKKVAAVLMAGALVVGNAFGDGERTLSADGKTLTFNVTSGIWTNTTPIESTVTTIVKEGAGDACLVPQTNTTFTGEITIKAGFFSGFLYSFGKPSKLTIENGGALVFLDLKTGSISGTKCPFWNTKFFIAGDGPDHYGAIQRPVTDCNSLLSCFCEAITLTGDAMINCGSRWGFGGTTLNMNNHKLTFSAGKHTYPGSKTMWNATFSPIFQLVRGGDLLVRNPGSIEAIDGANLLLEGNARVLDATDSNGTVSNMVVTLKNGTTLRLFSLTSKKYASCFKVRSEGSSSVKINRQAYFDGPIEAVGSKLSLVLYDTTNIPHLDTCGGLTATNAGTVVQHSDGSCFTFSGAHTNEVTTLYHKGSSSMTLADDNVFVMSNWCVGVDSNLAKPARMIVKDNAAILLRKDAHRKSWMDIGASGAQYGILEVSGNAVVSNALAAGYNGRGALYQNGGKVYMLDSTSGNRGDNNAYWGYNGYGYYGMNDGYFSQGYWLNLGGSSNQHGFIVQRGGVMEHWDEADPVRMCFSGDDAYANITQLGGRSVWKGYPTMGFTSYQPVCNGSTCTITISGTNTLMDMSSNATGIRMVASTNVLKKAWTGNVNINDGGTLHIKSICMTQMGGTTQGTPAWDTLNPEWIHQASKPYINFNGGILKTAKNGEFFQSTETDHRRELERVTVYEKGAIIDTDGKNVTWRMPFLKPYGYGIKSVTLPETVTASSATNILIGPTRCYITSAVGGFAGDLLMDFSNDTRRVMGVLVNCPGCGYEQTPTVKFAKASCSSSDTWSCTVETVNFDDAAFAHGGLTKRGAGTLTLTSTNTYGGATRCEGGTLAFTAANGIPSGSVLEFAATAVASADKATALLTAVDYTGSMVVRITEAETLGKATFGRVKTLATFTTALATTPTLEMVATDGTPVDAAHWHLLLLDNGKTLKFGVNSGTTLLLR